MKISYTSTSTIINDHQATALVLTVFSTSEMFRFDCDTVSHIPTTKQICSRVVLLSQSSHCCIEEQSLVYIRGTLQQKKHFSILETTILL